MTELTDERDCPRIWLHPHRGDDVVDDVEPGLAIHIEPVIRGDLEGTKGFAGVRNALLKVRIKHLFPTRRVYGGGVRDHAVEVEQDGIVFVAGDGTLALGLL